MRQLSRRLEPMIYQPNMLMIGSADRNVGKTEMACALIRSLAPHQPIAALKVTTIRETNGACPRGGKGCGVCTALDGEFLLTDETEGPPGKDTTRMLAAGARPVLWLRARRDSLGAAAATTLAQLDSTTPVICESNSLRHVVEPGLFLMMQRLKSQTVKTSAAAVWDLADRVIPIDLNNGGASAPDHPDFAFVDGVWSMRQEATAIVLSGGDSRRMGRDKGSLPMGGRALIAHICARLRPHFAELLIGARFADDYAFVGERVVPDPVRGEGPLMGIAACLAASTHDVNLVMACDIPGLDVGLLRRMLRLAPDHDCVVPRAASGRPEPLFAIYRKSALPAVRQTLASGARKVREAFGRCRTAYVEVESGRELINLNTMDEYRAYTASGDGVVKT